jgi:hypothetical protein
MNNYKVAFLVLSCDKYSDLWEPFAQLLERYWHDCPFDKYFATNQIPFDRYGFKSVLTGEDKTWSRGLQTALLQLKDRYDYVLITLEDLFILNTVNTKFINNCINKFIAMDGHYLRLYDKNRRPHFPVNDYLEKMDKNILYRHNCVYSLWKAATLLEILVPEENAWQFEKIGRKRTAFMDGFYISNKDCFIVSNTVIKGKWVRRELKRVKGELPKLTIHRDVFSVGEELKLYVWEICFRCFFLLTPQKVQTKLMNVLFK